MDDNIWLIWSNEHDVWWRPNRKGYTPDRKLAGRYSYYDAFEICRSANQAAEEMPNELMVPDF